MGASFIALCGFLPTIEQRFTKLSDSLLGLETKAQHKVVLTMSQQAVGEGLVHTSPSGVSTRNRYNPEHLALRCLPPCHRVWIRSIATLAHFNSYMWFVVLVEYTECFRKVLPVKLKEIHPPPVHFISNEFKKLESSNYLLTNKTLFLFDENFSLRSSIFSSWRIT